MKDKFVACILIPHLSDWNGLLMSYLLFKHGDPKRLNWGLLNAVSPSALLYRTDYEEI